ncbi:hypothetical protein DB30_01005 [Enhygromyxa salina]|uniref:Uncharacterized protein n=1 Tax=Enhygromyxa salina TaxID=215803 RepID=A0A0C2CY94_9BACT|nr:hypothetical protein DB30_01005 [Enhygromyxa salina]
MLTNNTVTTDLCKADRDTLPALKVTGTEWRSRSRHPHDLVKQFTHAPMSGPLLDSSAHAQRPLLGGHTCGCEQTHILCPMDPGNALRAPF